VNDNALKIINIGSLLINVIMSFRNESSEIDRFRVLYKLMKLLSSPVKAHKVDHKDLGSSFYCETFPCLGFGFASLTLIFVVSIQIFSFTELLNALLESLLLCDF